jgi:hypothetical protein
MSNPVEIRVGSQYIGQVALQNNLVTGEGGPHDARLVFPLTVMLHPRPLNQALALLDVSCSLHLTGSASDQNQIGPTITMHLAREQVRVRTFQKVPANSGFEVRLPLSQPLLTLIEAHRHEADDKAFRAYLRLAPTIGWLYEIGNSGGVDGTPEAPMDQLDQTLGLYFKFAQLWTSQIADLSVDVPATAWVQKVLPGLGLDRLRLLEISLPEAGGLVPDGVVAHFDAARRDYDLGNYRECIEKCRYVRDALTQHLGTTRDKQLGDVVADRRGLSPDAPVRSFWNGIWRGTWDMTNAGHHVLVPQPFMAADARACLMAVTLILDYLGQTH